MTTEWTERWRYRRQGFLFALLIATAAGALGSIWVGSVDQPPLSSAQKRVLAEYGFEPIVIVKTIEPERTPAPPQDEPGAPELTERIGVEVSPAPPTVFQWLPPIEIPAKCPDYGPQEISGGCEVIIAGTGADRMGAGSWWADVKGKAGWTARSERQLRPDEIEIEATEQSVDRPGWRSRWLLGGLMVGDSIGPLVSWQVERRRWALQVGMGTAFEVPAVSYVDQEIPRVSGSVAPVLTFQISRAGRSR